MNPSGMLFPVNSRGVGPELLQGVVFAGRNRVELVIVATSARDREPEERPADDVHAVVEFLGDGLFAGGAAGCGPAGAEGVFGKLGTGGQRALWGC